MAEGMKVSGFGNSTVQGNKVERTFEGSKVFILQLLFVRKILLRGKGAAPPPGDLAHNHLLLEFRLMPSSGFHEP